MATIRQAIGLLILAACLGACGSLKFKPVNGQAPQVDCHGNVQQVEAVFSGLEDSLRRAGAYWTPKMKLFSGAGMMEKTARLYVLNRKRHVLVLHLMHNVELEIRDYALMAKGDSATLVTSLLRVDTRHTVGQVTDEYLYAELSAQEAAALAREAEVRLSVGDLHFEMPYACREPMRQAVEKVTARGPEAP